MCSIPKQLFLKNNITTNNFLSNEQDIDSLYVYQCSPQTRHTPKKEIYIGKSPKWGSAFKLTFQLQFS